MISVIPLTRLNGSHFALNPDLVLRADATPDTVLTTTDGTKYVVTESLDEVIRRIVSYRAAIVRAATLPQEGEGWVSFDRTAEGEATDDATAPDNPTLHLPGIPGGTVVPLRPRKG